MKRARVVLLLAAAPCGLTAAEFQSWHIFDFVPVATARLDLTLHSQVRTRSRFGEVYMFRIGPIARVSVHPNVRLAAGYYYRDIEDALEVWSDSHRVFFGMENPFSRGRIAVQSRAYLERYFGASTAPYYRFRHRFRLSWERTVAPYAAMEYCIVAQGLQALRYTAGVQRRLSPGVRLDVGYQYDDFHIGVDRQALVTGLRFDLHRNR